MEDAAIVTATDCATETLDAFQADTDIADFPSDMTRPDDDQPGASISATPAPRVGDDASLHAARSDGETLRAPAACDGGPSPARIVEALLFSADAPLSSGRLGELANITLRDVRAVVEQLNEHYGASGLSFRIEAVAGGYQMMTLPVFSPWLAKLNQQRSLTRLTDAALETLAIVAYRQPIIRADVESIRGVACGDALNRLRELGLLRIVGRAEIVGRPMLYGTTKKFLDLFGLASLEELPPMEALRLRPAPKPDILPTPPVAATEAEAPRRAVAGA